MQDTVAVSAVASPALHVDREGWPRRVYQSREDVPTWRTTRAARVAEFITPLQVKPGTKVDLGKDFDPRYKAEFLKKKDGVRAAEDGDRVARGLSGAAGGPGHLRRAGLPAGAGRRRQGRDDPSRHERRESAGSARQQLQGAVRGGARPRLPVALCPPAARAWRYRDLQPVPLRGGSGRARAPGEPRPAEAAEGVEGQGRVGAPLPGDQRLGALPDRQRIQGGEDVPEPVQGGAAYPVPEADRPAGEELEVLGGRRPGNAAVG